jgi:putative aminopeptidase FrvX
VNADLLRRLLTTPGISGREDRIRAIVKEELAPICDSVRTDRLGSVIGVRRGNGPKVMVCAHMDTIGFFVRHIDDDGFIRVAAIGGFDPRTLVAQRVIVQGKNDYVGLMSSIVRPIHALDEEEAKKTLKMDDVVVDLMMPAEEVKANVTIGDSISFHREPLITDAAVSAPYLDDRLGVYVVIEALRRVSDSPAEVHAVISVQEEVGVRGARTSAYEIEPDIGIAVDVTDASDLPGVDKAQRNTVMGDGCAVSMMNALSISDPRLIEAIAGLARGAGIAYQYDMLVFGGTDAGAIQIAKAGVPAITLSVPTRYVHTTNETALISDIEATIELLTRFLERAPELDLTW